MLETSFAVKVMATDFTKIVRSLTEKHCISIRCTNSSKMCQVREFLQKRRNLESDPLFISVQNLIACQKSITLFYEDHIKLDPVVAYKEVCGFLGVPCERVDVVFRRINPEPMSLPFNVIISS